jgi:hypothetical protein
MVLTLHLLYLEGVLLNSTLGAAINLALFATICILNVVVTEVIRHFLLFLMVISQVIIQEI